MTCLRECNAVYCLFCWDVSEVLKRFHYVIFHSCLFGAVTSSMPQIASKYNLLCVGPHKMENVLNQCNCLGISKVSKDKASWIFLSSKSL